MYQSMADLIRINGELKAENDQQRTELAALKLAFRALNINPQTLNHSSPDFWSQFETLRPLAEACHLGGPFDTAIATRTEQSLDALYDGCAAHDSPSAERLEDAANTMSTWVMESRHLSSTVWKLRRALDAARKVLP
jgi:hypothetical protein